MNVTEFSNEFDIAYNSIATNSAPGIDEYEKSVYLTRAQLEIVNNYFNPRGNKYNRGFEASSKRRADLRELVRPGLSTTLSTALVAANDGLSLDSQFFKIPDSVFMIIQEKARVTSTDVCVNATYLKVVPKTHDEFNTQENNPFKKPDEKVIWRVDIYSKGELSVEDPTDSKVVELISPYTINQYKFRYIIFPAPIILVNLINEYPFESLTIDGLTQLQTCKLGENIHREILNRAVELALGDYKPADLAVHLELNKRNE